MTDKKKSPNPNSLANLKPIHSSEHARMMQKKGVEKRKENKAKREALALAAKEFQECGIDMPSAYDTLKILQARAIAEDDHDEIARIAALLLPYEMPRLASQEVAVSNKIEDLTEEELRLLMEEDDEDDSDE